jgi:glutaredoxin 3
MMSSKAVPAGGAGKSARGMVRVEIYTTPSCPYCWRAKRLLQTKEIPFAEIDLWQEPGRRAEMVQRAEGRRTVPQLFIDGRGIGGSDELIDLDARGALDTLLNAGAGAGAADGGLGRTEG